MTVEELLARTSSQELTEWEAFFKTHPFGYDRLDLGFAIIAATVANTFRGKSRRRYELKDFLPRFTGGDGRIRQSPEDQLALIEALNKSLGGADLRGSS